MRYLFHIILSLTLLSTSCSSDKKDQLRRKHLKDNRNALQIILKNDCLHCHSIEDRVVGPPYIDISHRYVGQPQVKSKLQKKIKEGGGGMWYGGMMSGHPLLKRDEVNKIVNWILSIEERHKAFNKAVKSEKISELTENSQGTKGFLIKALQLDRPIYDLNKNTDALVVIKGSKSSISLTGDSAFKPLQQPFLIKATGNLSIKEKGKYFFRLQKTGVGQVALGGNTIISKDKDDTEIALDLDVKNYPIVLSYAGLGKNDTLIFSWIPPGKEYYSVLELD
ncbi:MAG: c-type cytochrome [Cyclobacteriaceae bacterium]